MSLLKTTLITTALILGSASTGFAQESIVDQAKNVVVDKATSMAKDKATDMIGGDKAQMVDPAMKVGKDMMSGDSAKDALMKAGTSEAKGTVMGDTAVGGTDLGGITDTSLSNDETITAGKVLLKGGSKEDAAIAVAKDRGKNKIKDFGSSTVYGAAPTAPTSAPVEAAPAATPAVLAVNCPAGTTAQNDGSCMITGDYKAK